MRMGNKGIGAVMNWLQELWRRWMAYNAERFDLEVALIKNSIALMTSGSWWSFKTWQIGSRVWSEWMIAKYDRDPFLVMKWVSWMFIIFATLTNPAGVWREFFAVISIKTIIAILLVWLFLKSTYCAPWLWRIKEYAAGYYPAPATLHGELNFIGMLSNIIVRIVNTGVLIHALQIAAAGMDPRLGAIVERTMYLPWMVVLEGLSFGLYLCIPLYHFFLAPERIARFIESIQKNQKWLNWFCVAFIIAVIGLYIYAGLAWLLLAVIGGTAITSGIGYALSLIGKSLFDGVGEDWDWNNIWETLLDIWWFMPTATTIAFTMVVCVQWVNVKRADALQQQTMAMYEAPMIEAPAMTLIPMATFTQTWTETPVWTATLPATVTLTSTATETPTPTPTGEYVRDENGDQVLLQDMKLPEMIANDSRVEMCTTNQLGSFATYQINVDPDTGACANGYASYSVASQLYFVNLRIVGDTAQYTLDGNISDTITCTLNGETKTGKSGMVKISPTNKKSRLECPEIGLIAITWPK